MPDQFDGVPNASRPSLGHVHDEEAPLTWFAMEQEKRRANASTLRRNPQFLETNQASKARHMFRDAKPPSGSHDDAWRIATLILLAEDHSRLAEWTIKQRTTAEAPPLA